MPAKIDEALEVLKNTGPEFGHGFSNHGPMAAEAMIRLDRFDDVVSWTERYRKRLHEHPEAQNPIGKSDWREALGDHKRVGDWVNFFKNELRESSFRKVLAKWVPILAPGMMAGGTHGLIRSGHATRSLDEEVNELRLGELAEGLAYWASSFVRLPGVRQPGSGDLRPSKAIQEVPIVPEDERGKYKLIEESMQALELVPFAAVVNQIDVSGDWSRFLSELTENTAASYLANATTIGHAIAMIHSVTAPGMLRILMPHVETRDRDAVLGYIWQTVMGLYSVTGQQGLYPSCDNFDVETEDELKDRAVGTKDEHAIKFAEACLREYSMNPKPIYLAATSHASRLIGKEPVSPALARC